MKPTFYLIQSVGFRSEPSTQRGFPKMTSKEIKEKYNYKFPETK